MITGTLSYYLSLIAWIVVVFLSATNAEAADPNDGALRGSSSSLLQNDDDHQQLQQEQQQRQLDNNEQVEEHHRDLIASNYMMCSPYSQDNDELICSFRVNPDEISNIAGGGSSMIQSCQQHKGSTVCLIASLYTTSVSLPSQPVPVIQPTPQPIQPTPRPVQPTPRPVQPTPLPVQPTQRPVQPTSRPVLVLVQPPVPAQQSSPTGGGGFGTGEKGEPIYDHVINGSNGWNEKLQDGCPNALPTEIGNEQLLKCALSASKKCCYKFDGDRAVICQCTGNFFWNPGLTFECRQGSASDC